MRHSLKQSCQRFARRHRCTNNDEFGLLTLKTSEAQLVSPVKSPPEDIRRLKGSLRSSVEHIHRVKATPAFFGVEWIGAKLLLSALLTFFTPFLLIPNECGSYLKKNARGFKQIHESCLPVRI